MVTLESMDNFEKIHLTLSDLKNNLRALRFLWHTVHADDPYSNINPDNEPTDISSYLNDLNGYIYLAKDEKRLNRVNKLKDLYSRTRVDDSELKWIDPNDTRLCYWVWMMLVYRNRRALYGSWKDQTELINYSNQELNLNFHNKNGPSNNCILSKDQHREIVHFFDFVVLDRNEKIKIIRSLKSNWISVKKHSFSWLDIKNEEQCSWFWSHIKKPNRISDAHKFSTVTVLDANTSEQQFSMGIAIFDSWPAIDDTKELFLRDIRKAWSQIKYRNKDSDKKSYSFLLKADTKKLLDQMAERKSMGKSEYLDWLIRSSHFEETKYLTK